jgi:hypothetical protein
MSIKTQIIKLTEASLIDFLTKLTSNFSEYSDVNLVLDFSEKMDIKVADLKIFSDISKTQFKRKKSLVLVVKNVNFNALPKSIVAVPSLQEAHDLIEMDEIERDLGF